MSSENRFALFGIMLWYLRESLAEPGHDTARLESGEKEAAGSRAPIQPELIAQ
ncbi:MAG: hypothetical protein AB7K04_06020 [Pseudorhodoplanes sp.]